MDASRENTPLDADAATDHEPLPQAPARRWARAAGRRLATLACAAVALVIAIVT